MDNFQIETAQNIQIQQRIASLGDRVLAYILDGLIQAFYWIGGVFLLAAVADFDGDSVWVFYLVFGIPPFLYFLLFELFMDGRTPGKAAMKLRVVKLDGSKASASSYFIRWIIRLVDITLSGGGIAILCILLGGKGQRLGDIAAGTAVISEKSKIKTPYDLLADVPQDHQPVYPQVTRLSDRQFAEIKEILETAIRKEDFLLIKKLAERTADLLEVTPETKSLDFLRQVILDYTYYTQQ